MAKGGGKEACRGVVPNKIVKNTINLGLAQLYLRVKKGKQKACPLALKKVLQTSKTKQVCLQPIN